MTSAEPCTRGCTGARRPASCSRRCRPDGAMATCTCNSLPAQACLLTPAVQAHLKQALQVLSIVHLQRQQGVLQRLQLLQGRCQLPLSFCRVLPHSPAGGRETEESPGGSASCLSAEGRHASPLLHRLLHRLQHSPAGQQRTASGEAAVKHASSTCRAPLHTAARSRQACASCPGESWVRGKQPLSVAVRCSCTALQIGISAAQQAAGEHAVCWARVGQPTVPRAAYTDMRAAGCTVAALDALFS